MRNIAIVASVAALVAAAPASAWNGRGHMIVAAKAWEHLTPQTRVRVGQLLRHNPQYASWVQGVPANDRARVAFIQASTWPDDIKSEQRFPQFRNDQITGPNRVRNTGYDDCNRHKFWHYTNIPFSPDGTPLVPTRQPNIETQITTFAATLANPNASDEVKSYDLTWLLHLVGDAHQPLHSAARFISADPDGDAGGLDVLVCINPGCGGSALHSFWDNAFGGSENVTSVTNFASQLVAPSASKAAILAPSAWLSESFELAKSEVYQAPIGIGLGPFLITPAYRLNAQRVTREQVALAGVRLANVINGANLQIRGDQIQQRTCT